MPLYPFLCKSCGHYEPSVYVHHWKAQDPECPDCMIGPMERHIGLPALMTDTNFENGGRFFNKSAQEWQDRGQWKKWVKDMEKKGFHLKGNDAGKRTERHEKIGSKISEQGPAYATHLRKQFQKGGKDRLDIV
jgi:hypothetical protein